MAVLVLNVIWLATTRGSWGKAAAAAGIVFAALAVVRPARLRHTWPELPRAAVVIPLFALPALAWLGTPRIAVLFVNARTWLILAWLAASALMVLRPAPVRGQPDDGRGSRSAAAMLLFWAAFFWLVVVSDLGIGRTALTLHRDADLTCHSDPLTTIFTIWRTHPISEHALLGFRTAIQFDARTPYASHMHAFLILIFAWSAVTGALTHFPSFALTNTIPFMYMGIVLVGVGLLLARSGLLDRIDGPYEVAMLVMTMGFVATTWRFWHDMYTFSTDSPFPLLAGIVLILAALLRGPVRTRAASVAAAAFGALDPYLRTDHVARNCRGVWPS